MSSQHADHADPSNSEGGRLLSDGATPHLELSNVASSPPLATSVDTPPSTRSDAASSASPVTNTDADASRSDSRSVIPITGGKLASASAAVDTHSVGSLSPADGTGPSHDREAVSSSSDGVEKSHSRSSSSASASERRSLTPTPHAAAKLQGHRRPSRSSSHSHLSNKKSRTAGLVSMSQELTVPRRDKDFKMDPSMKRRETFRYAEPKRGKLTLRVKLLYALPQFSLISLTMLITVHAPLFYVSHGMTLPFLAFFTALARSFDVLTDPLMAWISDSTRTRWGRRRPYMAVACIGYSVAFIFLMSPSLSGSTFIDADDATVTRPPTENTTNVAVWFGVWYVVFYVFDTIGNVPYTALGPELTDDSKERVSLFTWTKGVTFLGTLAGAAGPGLLDTFIDDVDLQFLILALFFGAWFIISMEALAWHIKERKESLESRATPLVPSVRRSFRNKPFRPLLIGWILDFISLAALSALLPFFIEYYVRPTEFSSTQLLSFTLGGMFISAIASIPVWAALVKRFEKRQVWLAYNLLNSVTTLAFLAIGQGDEYALIFVSCLNGLPVGGQFLIDSILSDIIDYDEFLNFTRTEGGFTVFATFIPKLVSIPAQALPLAVLSAVGFQENISTPQTDAVISAIQIMFIAIPCVCTLISFFVKLTYPIKTDTMVDQIYDGIQEHMRGKGARDPVTGEWVVIQHLIQEDEDLLFLVDNFPRERVRLLMEERAPNDEDAVSLLSRSSLTRETQCHILCGAAATVTCVTGIGITVSEGLLEEPKLAWLPLLLAMLTGVSVVYTAFNGLRLKPSGDLTRLTHESNAKRDMIKFWTSTSAEERAALRSAVSAVERAEAGAGAGGSGSGSPSGGGGHSERMQLMPAKAM